jgi:hypothetical protein
MKLGYSGEQILESTRSILGSLLLVRSDGTTKVVANGFRNPQGIGYFETLNKIQILQSEHAPRGGDELNDVTQGNFYGWPTFSFGTQYSPNNPLDSPEAPNTAGTSVKPLFSWLPSIGPSKVHQVKSSVLRRYWADSSNGFFGDVIVAGMGSQSLYRLRILDSKVVYSVFDKEFDHCLGKDFARKASLNSLLDEQLSCFEDGDCVSLQIGGVKHADAIVQELRCLGRSVREAVAAKGDRSFMKMSFLFLLPVLPPLFFLHLLSLLCHTDSSSCSFRVL